MKVAEQDLFGFAGGCRVQVILLLSNDKCIGRLPPMMVPRPRSSPSCPFMFAVSTRKTALMAINKTAATVNLF